MELDTYVMIPQIDNYVWLSVEGSKKQTTQAEKEGAHTLYNEPWS